MTAAAALGERVAAAETRLEATDKRVDELRADVGAIKSMAIGILVTSICGLAGILFQVLTGKH